MGHKKNLAEPEQPRDASAGVWVLPGATSLTSWWSLPGTGWGTATYKGEQLRGVVGGTNSGPGLHLPAGYSQAK